MSFKDKVVVVTGSSSGIGAATAVLFAKEGADVVIVARNEAKMKNVAAKCAEAGKEPLVIKADVAKQEDAEKIIQDTIAKVGKLDILVNNAGITRIGTILDGSGVQVYDEVMNTNFRSVVQLTNLAAPHLIKTKGNIVNISSITASIINSIKFTIYGISKAALNHYSRACAVELAPFGVRVNVISPGPVYTDILENAGFVGARFEVSATFTALKRVSDPEEIGEAVLYLASDKARGITGSELVTDNGYIVNRC